MNKNRASYLYRCFAGNELLYVGISIDLNRRMKEHSRFSKWHQEMDRWTWELIGNRAAALVAEAEAIYTEQPKHNIQQNEVAA